MDDFFVFTEELLHAARVGGAFGRMETIMADSEEIWIRKRAYALWEEEGYPSGKDREHWERAKLEYAALKPVASKASPAASRRKTAAAVKPPEAAPRGKPAPSKAVSSKTATKTAAPKAATAKPAPAKKTASKAPAAIPASVEPTKKRSRKVPAGA